MFSSILQLFSSVLQMFANCSPTVLQLLSLCKEHVGKDCWCERRPDNIEAVERSQAFIQLKPCQHPHCERNAASDRMQLLNCTSQRHLPGRSLRNAAYTLFVGL
jgi:hypothetical protein